MQLSLEEKKSELTPRISMPDFLQLRPWATVLDVRDEEEYARQPATVLVLPASSC